MSWVVYPNSGEEWDTEQGYVLGVCHCYELHVSLSRPSVSGQNKFNFIRLFEPLILRLFFNSKVESSRENSSVTDWLLWDVEEAGSCSHRWCHCFLSYRYCFPNFFHLIISLFLRGLLPYWSHSHCRVTPSVKTKHNVINKSLQRTVSAAAVYENLFIHWKIINTSPPLQWIMKFVEFNWTEVKKHKHMQYFLQFTFSSFRSNDFFFFLQLPGIIHTVLDFKIRGKVNSFHNISTEQTTV